PWFVGPGRAARSPRGSTGRKGPRPGAGRALSAVDLDVAARVIAGAVVAPGVHERRRLLLIFGRQAEAAVCVGVGPAGEAVLAHALSELPLLGQVGRGGRMGRRGLGEPVVDRSTGLLRPL